MGTLKTLKPQLLSESSGNQKGGMFQAAAQRTSKRCKYQSEAGQASREIREKLISGFHAIAFLPPCCCTLEAPIPAVVDSETPGVRTEELEGNSGAAERRE